jgi:hypothetical protein
MGILEKGNSKMNTQMSLFDTNDDKPIKAKKTSQNSQIGMFSQSEIAQFGVKSNPRKIEAPNASLELFRQNADGKTDEQLANEAAAKRQLPMTEKPPKNVHLDVTNPYRAKIRNERLLNKRDSQRRKDGLINLKSINAIVRYYRANPTLDRDLAMSDAEKSIVEAHKEIKYLLQQKIDTPSKAVLLPENLALQRRWILSAQDTIIALRVLQSEDKPIEDKPIEDKPIEDNFIIGESISIELSGYIDGGYVTVKMLHATIKAVTDKAIQIECANQKRAYTLWIPKRALKVDRHGSYDLAKWFNPDKYGRWFLSEFATYSSVSETGFASTTAPVKIKE